LLKVGFVRVYWRKKCLFETYSLFPMFRRCLKWLRLGEIIQRISYYHVDIISILLYLNVCLLENSILCIIYTLAIPKPKSNCVKDEMDKRYSGCGDGITPKHSIKVKDVGKKNNKRYQKKRSKGSIIYIILLQNLL
jgi:hypothetical protein